ncbi:hypothetical protein FVEG_03552 [Fusarium verticillioides 7600]|uniref:Uncharacterized protein n=1 Tax=Gibberella moniliformis (strain M3125 / FGSC 7600) TaxID=334819 RepID=W7M1M0_GIBM7|nr:hypothetical protein FVEG_03552 [Fusarium verticillioides 7600]EWG41430.1 hypothetical protein FVEG_03552 [Fusarium verticillioides 7600]
MSPDQQMKQQQEKKSRDSAMLQIWLNEPEDVVSSTDTWSSQRAGRRRLFDRYMVKSTSPNQTETHSRTRPTQATKDQGNRHSTGCIMRKGSPMSKKVACQLRT